MTGEQIRAARALLSWTAAELGKKSGVSYPTVQRLDATKGQVRGQHTTIRAIRQALEGAGIQFLNAADLAEGQGVAIKSEAVNVAD